MDIGKEIEDLTVNFEACHKTISAMGDETRQHIILEMMRMDYNGSRVMNIAATTNLSKPSVSHHLQNTVILSCSTLSDYVKAAQQTCHTVFPVAFLDRRYHVEPARMREHILQTIRDLPEEVDTVLVAMGFCGGSWQDVTVQKKLVIPRVDDCVSIVMTTNDSVNPCTKQMGHMYVFGGESEGFSIGGIYESLMKEYEPEIAQSVFDMMFENYRNVDIVDTGIYDCYDPSFVETVQTDADRIHAELDFVPGSNLLLEKLVSGRWDDQFFIVEPNARITQSDFFGV